MLPYVNLCKLQPPERIDAHSDNPLTELNWYHLGLHSGWHWQRLARSLHFQAQERVLQARVPAMVPDPRVRLRSHRTSSLGMRSGKAPCAHDRNYRHWNDLFRPLCSGCDFDDVRH